MNLDDDYNFDGEEKEKRKQIYKYFNKYQCWNEKGKLDIQCSGDA